MNLLDQIPGLREAVEQENLVRQAAFLDVDEKVCGIPVRPLTPRHLVILDSIGSPFMHGGLPSPADVVATLWILSPDYTPRSGFTRWRWMHKARRIQFGEAVTELDRYFNESFQDAPGNNGGESGPVYYSFMAQWIDVLAHEYGWTIDTVMATPVKVLFQLFKAIRKRHQPSCTMFNPSDQVRGRWLSERNQNQ